MVLLSLLQSVNQVLRFRQRHMQQLSGFIKGKERGREEIQGPRRDEGIRWEVKGGQHGRDWGGITQGWWKHWKERTTKLDAGKIHKLCGDCNNRGELAEIPHKAETLQRQRNVTAGLRVQVMIAVIWCRWSQEGAVQSLRERETDSTKENH